VHGRAGVLHALRHEGRDIVCAVQTERGQAEAGFRDARCDVEMTLAEMVLDFLQRMQVVAHIGERVLDQRRRESYKFSGVFDR